MHCQQPDFFKDLAVVFLKWRNLFTTRQFIKS